MSSRGWEHVTEADIASKVSRGSVRATRIDSKPSKYRNVRTVVGGEKFDSGKEAAYWVGLQARERAGEIQGLERQVKFPLYCPKVDDGYPELGTMMHVSEYVADFVYFTGFDRHVVDAKGQRTRMYLLKRKWLELQCGIVIEEV